MPIYLPSGFWGSSWTGRQGVNGRLGAAILAAGMGRRLEPLSGSHLPKPMLPLGASVPMSELWVRKLVASGITDISMNVCVLRQVIERHFCPADRFCAELRMVGETVPSGTLGGVCKQAFGRAAQGLDPEDEAHGHAERTCSTLVVLSGDIVTRFGADELAEAYEIHQRQGAAISMILVPVPWDKRKDFGTVVLDRPEKRAGSLARSGRIIDFREKDPDSPSNLNNASIYLIEMDFLRQLDRLRTPASFEVEAPFYDFGKHVFPAMVGTSVGLAAADAGPLGGSVLWGIEYSGPWFDVGQKRDYIRVNEALLNDELDVRLPLERYPWGHLGRGVSMDLDRVTIIPPVVIGNDCVIEPGATVGPYAVIGDGWTVGAAAGIRHSVLWERVPYFDAEGRESPAEERRRVDAHVIEPGVFIEESIVTGGRISQSLHEQIADVLMDGAVELLPLDWEPGGPRL